MTRKFRFSPFFATNPPAITEGENFFAPFSRIFKFLRGFSRGIIVDFPYMPGDTLLATEACSLFLFSRLTHAFSDKPLGGVRDRPFSNPKISEVNSKNLRKINVFWCKIRDLKSSKAQK